MFVALLWGGVFILQCIIGANAEVPTTTFASPGTSTDQPTPSGLSPHGTATAQPTPSGLFPRYLVGHYRDIEFHNVPASRFHRVLGKRTDSKEPEEKFSAIGNWLAMPETLDTACNLKAGDNTITIPDINFNLATDCGRIVLAKNKQSGNIVELVVIDRSWSNSSATLAREAFLKLGASLDDGIFELEWSFKNSLSKDTSIKPLASAQKLNANDQSVNPESLVKHGEKTNNPSSTDEADEEDDDDCDEDDDDEAGEEIAADSKDSSVSLTNNSDNKKEVQSTQSTETNVATIAADNKQDQVGQNKNNEAKKESYAAKSTVDQSESSDEAVKKTEKQSNQTAEDREKAQKAAAEEKSEQEKAAQQAEEKKKEAEKEQDESDNEAQSLSLLKMPYDPSAKATFFSQNGAAGNCGQVHKDSDFLVALPTALYQNGGDGAWCGKKILITNTSNKKTVVATVADSCPSCETVSSLDLSDAAWQALEQNTSIGMLPITWKMLDGEDTVY